MSTQETWVIPVSLGADQANRFQFDSPVREESGPGWDPGQWLTDLRSRLVEAWCVVTDTEVHGPYVTWEEAQSVLDEGVAGDVFSMTYR